MEILDDDLAAKLHLQSVLGEPLSAEEQTQLQAWYDAGDREEAEMLRANRRRRLIEDGIEDRILETVKLIETLLKRIREVEAENESLRQEIAALRAKAVVYPESQAA